MSLIPTQNKSVLITGCSSGIGLCVAKGLKARGYDVIATTRKAEDVDLLNSEGLTSCQLDLDDTDSIKNAIAFVLQHTGGSLYALFNNGAYGQPGAVEDLRRDVLRAQFETNFFGWAELTRQVIPIMRKQGYGRIIQNSSILGIVALKFRGAYNASKYAIEGLTDTLRLELENSNIYVSLIEPGPIESRFRANANVAFEKNIDKENSFFSGHYQATVDRLQKEGPAVPFTLPPEAVLKKVMHALESSRPKVRYYVTFPTYLFATLKRVLPYWLLDKLLIRIS